VTSSLTWKISLKRLAKGREAQSAEIPMHGTAISEDIFLVREIA
jgi:hypothetical protein